MEYAPSSLMLKPGVEEVLIMIEAPSMAQDQPIEPPSQQYNSNLLGGLALESNVSAVVQVEEEEGVTIILADEVQQGQVL